MPKIVWSQKAKDSYLQIIPFIFKEWGEAIVARFDGQIEEKLSLLQSQPRIGKKTSHLESVRKCIINPIITLYYRESKKEIILLLFWDNRQNPKKFPLGK